MPARDCHRSWKMRSQSGSLMWLVETKIFETSLIASQCAHEQKAGISPDSNKVTLMWGAGILNIMPHAIPSLQTLTQNHRSCWHLWFFIVCVSLNIVFIREPLILMPTTVIHCFLTKIRVKCAIIKTVELTQWAINHSTLLTLHNLSSNFKLIDKHLSAIKKETKSERTHFACQEISIRRHFKNSWKMCIF